MAVNIANLATIQKYAVKHRRDLIQLAVGFNELTENCAVAAGVKDKETMTELRFKSLMKPYAKNWSPDENKADLIPRTLQVELGQVELEEEPVKYRKTYLGNLMKKGVNPKDHPFEKEFLEGISLAVNNDIVLDTSFYGDYGLRESGTSDEKKSAKAVVDGFMTILDKEINAGNVSEEKKNLITTGDITSANAVSKLKKFYRDAANKNPAVRAKQTNMYISYNVYDAYCDNYQAENGALPYNQQYDHIYLEGSSRRCKLTPMAGLKDSKRIILTEEWNMVYGVDTVSDQENIEVFNPGNPKVTGFFVLFAIGFQFASLKALWTNEKEVDTTSP